MTSQTGDDLLSPNRDVTRVQKLLSAFLCLVAVAMSVYTASSGSWLFTAPLLAGSVFAVQSYRVAKRTAGPTDAGTESGA